MRRHLFNFATVVSLLLGLLIAVNWVMNLREGFLGRVGPRYTAFVLVERGTFTLYLSGTDAGYKPTWFEGSSSVVNDDCTEEFNWCTLGFMHAVGATAGGNPVNAWTIPDWFLIFLLAILPGICLWRWRHSQRAAAKNRCSNCGYNLAGNISGVCPECGVAISRSVGRVKPGATQR